jgi:fibronectin type 3 domain-containing protein
MRKEVGGSFAAIAKVTGTTYTDKTAVAGKTYYYTIRCMNDSGEYIGDYDKTGKSIVAPVVIVAPSVSLETNALGVVVSWDAVDGITQYRVLRKEQGGAFEAIGKSYGTTYTDKKAEAGKTYYYTVRCLNTTGGYVGTYDQNGKKITVPVADLPAPEVTLSNGKDGIEISWNAIDGAAKYRVLKQDVTGGFVALAKVSGTKYVDNDVVNGQTYCYTVRCVDADGKYIGSYNTNGVSIVRTAPAEPQAEITASITNDEGITFIWTGAEGIATKYRVLRKEGDGDYVPIAKVSQTGYTDKNVEYGKTYTYTIRLIDADGNYFGTYDKKGYTVTYILRQ